MCPDAHLRMLPPQAAVMAQQHQHPHVARVELICAHQQLQAISQPLGKRDTWLPWNAGSSGHCYHTAGAKLLCVQA